MEAWPTSSLVILPLTRQRLLELLMGATQVTAYIVSVPKQQWEFPLLPWVKFVTSFEEDNIQKIVQIALQHILEPDIQHFRRSRAVCL